MWPLRYCALYKALRGGPRSALLCSWTGASGGRVSGVGLLTPYPSDAARRLRGERLQFGGLA